MIQISFFLKTQILKKLIFKNKELWSQKHLPSIKQNPLISSLKLKMLTESKKKILMLFYSNCVL